MVSFACLATIIMVSVAGTDTLYRLYVILLLAGLGLLFAIEGVRSGGGLNRVCSAFSGLGIALVLYMSFLHPLARF